MGEIADELIGRAMEGDFGDEFDGEEGFDSRPRSHVGRESHAGRGKSSKPGAAPPDHNDDPANPGHIRIGFGKHRGKRLGKIPAQYIEWLLGCGGLDPSFQQQVEDYAASNGITSAKARTVNRPTGEPSGAVTSSKVRLSIPLPRGNQVDLWFRKHLLPDEGAWLDRLFAMANETVIEQPPVDVLGEPIRLPSVPSPPSPLDEEAPPW